MRLKRGPSAELPGHLVQLRDHHSARAKPLLDDLKKEWVEATRKAAGNRYAIDPLALPAGEALKEEPDDVLVSVFRHGTHLRQAFHREGDLRTYKIHLGSGNILMEPNDEYLCIVTARRNTKKVFLPFEEDSVLSVIVSKAFLLASDKRIKDKTIAAQIRRR